MAQATGWRTVRGQAVAHYFIETADHKETGDVASLCGFQQPLREGLVISPFDAARKTDGAKGKCCRGCAGMR